MISGVPLNNFGGENFGDIDLTTALTHSVNTVWAEVGVKVGSARHGRVHAPLRLLHATRRSTIRRPDVPSGVHVGRRTNLTPPAARVDVGRMAIGQGGLEVTPLQMADGRPDDRQRRRRMEPRLGRRVIDPDGRTVDDIGPAEATRVMSDADRAAS